MSNGGLNFGTQHCKPMGFYMILFLEFHKKFFLISSHRMEIIILMFSHTNSFVSTKLCSLQVDSMLSKIRILTVFACHARHRRGSGCGKARSDTHAELPYYSVKDSMLLCFTPPV